MYFPLIGSVFYILVIYTIKRIVPPADKNAVKTITRPHFLEVMHNLNLLFLSLFMMCYSIHAAYNTCHNRVEGCDFLVCTKGEASHIW